MFLLNVCIEAVNGVVITVVIDFTGVVVVGDTVEAKFSIL